MNLTVSATHPKHSSSALAAQYIFLPRLLVSFESCLAVFKAAKKQALAALALKNGALVQCVLLESTKVGISLCRDSIRLV